MKLTRLNLEAFGPFAEPMEIDFTRAEARGLYLIHGATGSGKTSLLDAVCFALYGTASGPERAGPDLRCHLAPDDRQARVQLDFSVGGAVWRVTRTLSPRRNKACEEKAVLERLDVPGAAGAELAADRRIEVNQRVASLLRLDAGQFRQVIMLPQGRFRDFLAADSGAREAILESLFDTGRLERFTRRLGERSQAAQAAVEALGQQRSLILAEAGLPPDGDTVQALAALQTTESEALARRDGLRRRLAELRLLDEALRARETARRELAAAETELARLEAGRPEQEFREARMRAALAARELAAGETALAASRRALADLEAAQARLSTELSQSLHHRDAAMTAAAHAARDRATLPALRERLATLGRLRDAAEVLARIDQSLDQDRPRLRMATQAAAARRDALERLSAAMSAEGAETTTSRAWADCRSGLEILAEAAANRRAAEAKRNAEESMQTRIEAAAPERARALAAAQAAAAAALAERDAWEARMRGASAAALAHRLEPGQPCPVCGATEHPRPASDTQLPPEPDPTRLTQAQAALAAVEAESIRQTERLDRCIADADAARTAAIAALDRAVAEAATLQSAAPAELAAWLASSSWQDDEPGLAAWLARARAARAAVAAADANRSAREAQAAELRDKLAADERELAATEARIAAREHDRTEAAARLAAERAAAPDVPPEPAALTRAAADLAATIDRIDSAAEQALAAAAEAERDAAALEARAAETAAAAATRRAETDERETACAAARTARGFADLAACRAAWLDDAACSRLERDIAAWRDALAVARTRAADAASRAGPGDSGTAPDAATVAADLAATQSSTESAEADCVRTAEARARLETAATRCAELDAARASAQAEADLLTGLHRCVNGQDSAGSYVNLKRYALSVHLDEVLAAANVHLADMSRERYRLVRKDEARGRRRTGGLELAVHDRHSGAERPTSSLSGGESFMAALALALGLSGVVHAGSGGVRLDTLFIDEGFGSLDEDALEDAMRVLGHVHAAGRSIGIISHVRELKERIPNRLAVRRTQRGSVAAWEGPRA